jgi:TolB-like protein
VLPLENLSHDPEQEYFADGMTEALITELSKISALKVISRTSVMQYKGIKKPMPQIARELGVDGVVEGSVAREGEQVRITVQLIHGPTDKHLWAESYQREMRGILALQGEVARAIANEVRVKLTPQEEGRLASARPVNPAAYEAYLRGRYHWNRRTGQDLRKATEYFLSATELDPTYSLAYAGLADSYALYNFYDVLPARESFPEARAAAERALQLDPTLVEAQTTIAFVTFYYDWDWTAADSQLERILQRRPDYANARQWYAEYLSLMGRHEEAIREIKQAQAYDPLSSIMRSQEAGFITMLATMTRRSRPADERFPRSEMAAGIHDFGPHLRSQRLVQRVAGRLSTSKGIERGYTAPRPGDCACGGAIGQAPRGQGNAQSSVGHASTDPTNAGAPPCLRVCRAG